MDMADPDTDVQKCLSAFNRTPEDHPAWGEKPHALSEAYYQRFLQKQEESDIIISFDLIRKLVDTTPNNHSERAQRLFSLCQICSDRESLRRTGIDLDNSISYFQEAVRLTPKDSLSRPNYLFNLIVIRCKRHHRGFDDDINNAISLYWVPYVHFGN